MENYFTSPSSPCVPSSTTFKDRVEKGYAVLSLFNAEMQSNSFANLEFDGTTVLCRVCGDKASGFHYGVHSCEGCKGFFRRSIQQKIQYRPCTKNQQCSILRINRNRCQYCRLKKCIAVGMSRDAVRFGRVPKREKAKILAAMQSLQTKTQEKALSAQLEDDIHIMRTVIQSHKETCDFTNEKAKSLLLRSRESALQFTSYLACPLNPNPQFINRPDELLQDFSERFSPAIRGVVEFAKRIPGFSMLPQDDQVTLLKAGVFEVLLVRLACMFDSQLMKRDAVQHGANARFLVDAMFEFAERLLALHLHDDELGMFTAVIVIAPDRPGLRNIALVEKMHNKLKEGLQQTLTLYHPNQPELMKELMQKLPDLRTLNALHSDKLLAFKATESHPANHWSPSLSDENVYSPIPCESLCSSEVASAMLRSSECINSSGDEDALHQTCYANRLNGHKLSDSPIDSGIESGNEKFDKVSACSSPHSIFEERVGDLADIDISNHDMPVLKRALQAPPLIQNRTHNDNYRHVLHKKFRRCEPSSMLARSLAQAPKLTVEQQQCTEYLHSVIVNGNTAAYQTVQMPSPTILCQQDCPWIQPLNLSTKV